MTAENKTVDDQPQAVIDHLEEIRWRLIKSLAVVGLIAVLLYLIIDDLLPLILKPIPKAVFIAPAEMFIARIKLAIIGGIYFGAPFVLYEAWSFIAVALTPREKRSVAGTIFFSLILFNLGAVFAAFVIIPLGLEFLLSFATEQVSATISIGKYISFVGFLALTFGLVFQLPLVMVFMARTGLIKPETFKEKRRAIIVFIFIAAAILTPPDPVTQCLMAIPLMVLYEIGMILARISARKRARRIEKDESEAA
ncbi:twin-arginine translocase subunit TatC [Planctomycetota bacterium]